MRTIVAALAILLVAAPVLSQPTAQPGGTPGNQGPSPVLHAPADDHERYPDYVRPTPPCGGLAPEPAPYETPQQPDATLAPADTTSGPGSTTVARTSPHTETANPATPTPLSPGQVAHEQVAVGSDSVAVDPGTAERDDRVRFWYDSTNGRVRFAYLATQDSPARGLELHLLSVVEYRDEDANGKFDLGELSLQEYRISEPLTHFSRAIEDECGFRLRWTYLLTVSASTIHHMPESEQKAFLEDKPRLTFQFTHSGATGPAAVKIDFAIDSFPFEPGRPDTRVAIRTSVYSLDQLAFRDDAGRPRLEGAHEGAAIGYAWDPTATADGQTVDVPFTVDEEDPRGGVTLAVSAFSVTYNYPQAAHVLHDPQLGLFSAAGAVARVLDAASGHPLAYVVGVAAATTLLASLLGSRRRFA